MSFKFPQHKNIIELLASMNEKTLLENNCFFGGGTAISLKNDEYRLSSDIKFICADVKGYRNLRNLAVSHGITAFFGQDAKQLKEFQTDQYGLRTLVSWNGQPIKFEIVREARISISGNLDPTLLVPILSKTDQFTEKLLANSDRAIDRSVAYRDAIDLGFLTMANNGIIPLEAINKATEAYGEDIPRKLQRVFEKLGSSEAELNYTAETLGMDTQEIKNAITELRQASVNAWPNWEFFEILFSSDEKFNW